MKKIINKKLKEHKAITLIALVVTIIVLIIIAGVSISLILGNNGIINKSQEGRNNYQLAANEEEYQMGKVSDEFDITSSRTASEEIAELRREIEGLRAQISSYSNTTWELIDSTTSTTHVKSTTTKNIDDYNYIAVATTTTNPVIVSVEAFKNFFNSSSRSLRSQWTSGEYADAYYNNGIYMRKSGTNTNGCYVYGIK